MKFVSNRAILMRPLLAALASVSLFSQLSLSGCAVGPSYRKPATTLEGSTALPRWRVGRRAPRRRPSKPGGMASTTRCFRASCNGRAIRTSILRQHWRESSRLGPQPVRPVRSSCQLSM
jgi:hypothetical protein